MNTETFFFVNLNNGALQLLREIPTLDSVPFPIVNATDCVENTLNFLGVITNNQASMLQECTKYETPKSFILEL